LIATCFVAAPQKIPLCQQAVAEENMETEGRSPKKQSLQRNRSVERLRRALPPLPNLDNCCLISAESEQMCHARLKYFRRVCEARTVLRWMVGEQFDITGYLTEVIETRGHESACTLKDDLVRLFHAVIKRNPLLRNLLHPQLKLCCVICKLQEDRNVSGET